MHQLIIMISDIQTPKQNTLFYGVMKQNIWTIPTKAQHKYTVLCTGHQGK